MILPSIMPDELARGYLGRICRLNGAISPDALRPYIEKIATSVVDKPEDCTWTELLATINQQTPHAFFSQHTVLPFSRAVRPGRECVNHGSRRDRLERIAHGCQFGLNQSLYRLCPKCVAEDLAFWGVSYWRRSHQLTAVARCHKHEVVLHEVKTNQWTNLPHDEVSTSIPLDTSIADDAANNPVIGRYTEICSALAERKCPVSTIQMVQTIRHQIGEINTNGNPSWSNLGAFVIEKISGPWQRHFFDYLTGNNSAPITESLRRTQNSVRMAYPTHFYALVLAALFKSADDAILQISQPTVPITPRRMKSCACRADVGLLAGFSLNTTLTAVLNDFRSGATIAEACRINGEDPHQFETLLRLATETLWPRIDVSN